MTSPRNPLPFITRLVALLPCAFLAAAPLHSQDQVDLGDKVARGSGAVSRLTFRIRVVKTVPEQSVVRVSWRHGGEGLGGMVVKGVFTSEAQVPDLALNAWSAWVPVAGVVGNVRGFGFATLVVASQPTDSAKAPKAGQAISETAVEFEFAESGKVFKSFTETAPKGATVGFAFPGAALGEKVNADFIAQLNGLSGHAHARREGLEKLFPEPSPMPKLFGVIGHLGGYGEYPVTGLGGAAGYGVRHCNPAILADECRTLRLLGINGMTDSMHLVDAAGVGQDFRRIFWGSPGSGSPMALLTKGARRDDTPDACPFDPKLKPLMKENVQAAIAKHRETGARESWALWTDEIGVFAKEHIAHCDRCAEQFREYLRTNKVPLTEVGAKERAEVKPFNIWVGADKKVKGASSMSAAPTSAAECMRYYWTFRFMTHATAQVFPEAAKEFSAAKIALYAMQGPTPSWDGSSLDWHEFYDHDANTAMVFETSNRDAQVWQFESYLGDIARGIAARHGMKMGCLVKPHRGAAAQRMLSVVARGVSSLEWYTYGPDYSKGDSFSQRPDLLEKVARATRLLGAGEDRLYGAKWAVQPEVAFVSPRSSEIWGKASELNVTAFENAKWVWLALTHAHIPMDILSEQQLAEGGLDRYKAIYIIGPNLRRDAAAKVERWVRNGGTLFTDALGLSRDEANQPATAIAPMLGLANRSLETWGSVAGYRAAGLKPLTETDAPAHAEFTTGGVTLHAGIAREPLDAKTAEVLAKFADGKPALTRNAHGKGEVFVAGFWSGLTYSAKVRRADFDMRADFDPNVRKLIAAPALNKHVAQPVQPEDPLVEAVLLNKDGNRSVALMNWAYHRTEATSELAPVKSLRISLAGAGNVKSVRSLTHGALPVTGNTVVLPQLDAIDLLFIE